MDMLRLAVLATALASCTAQRAGYGRSGGVSSYEEELMARQYLQQQQAAQQQQALRAQQQQAMYEAQLRAQQGQAAYSGARSGKPPLSKKEQKKEEKAMKKMQAEREKELKKRQKQQAKMLKAQQAGLGRRAVDPMRQRRGPIKALLSIKGIALLGSLGYMYAQQRELLMAIVLRLPLKLLNAVARLGWSVLLKPVLRLAMGRGRTASELPGGSY